MRHSRALLLALAVLVAPPPTRAECPRPQTLPREGISIATQSGEKYFDVEIADTEEAHAAGLMCRKALPADTGMLFIYPRAQVVRMWMKNTWIALDMLFVAADGRIVRVVTDVQPEASGRISARQPVRMVLELPAGSAARHGIHVGAKLRLSTSSRTEGPKTR